MGYRPLKPVGHLFIALQYNIYLYYKVQYFSFPVK